MRKILLSLILVLLCEIAKTQTCIFARLEKKNITVFSDTKITKQTYPTSDIAGDPETKVMKKIGGSNGVYFAVSGNDVIESFNVAESFYNQKISTDSVINAFIINRKARMNTIAEQAKKANIDKYNKRINDKIVMQFMFFRFIRRRPEIIKITIYVQEYLDTNERFGSIFYLRPHAIENIEIYRFGETKLPAIGVAHIEAIKDSLESEETWRGNTIIIGERLMRRQIDYSSEIVGAPIDILILRSNKKARFMRVN